MITTINEFKEIPNNYKHTIDNINEFFMSLFQLRQIAHDIHLTNSNYSEHMALGDFYDALLILIDDMFETYQGQFGLIKNYNTGMNYEYANQDVVTVFEAFTKLIKDKYKILFENESHLLNICDEIVALCYKTLYKLKYLK